MTDELLKGLTDEAECYPIGSSSYNLLCAAEFDIRSKDNQILALEMALESRKSSAGVDIGKVEAALKALELATSTIAELNAKIEEQDGYAALLEEEIASLTNKKKRG